MADPRAAPRGATQNIEADPDLYDASDSSLGDDVSRYTASLTSSIERYPIENGRRYHAFKDGSYIMPNDESELDRLDISHQMFKITMGDKLYLAPIDKPARILDVGTGTGIWAIEMGDDFPDSEILGTDLSPTQPTWVPANVKFEVDDAEESWTFPQKFDYVHCRYLAAAISDWPKLVGQCFQSTKVGGYSEFQDYSLRIHSDDGSVTSEHAMMKWNDVGLAACDSFGKDHSPGPKIEGWMKEAGFVDVHYERFPLPIGPWPKDKHLKTVGSWNLVTLEEGLEGMTMRLFTQVLGWKREEVLILLASVRKDFRDPKLHAQLDFHVTYGRKP